MGSFKGCIGVWRVLGLLDLAIAIGFGEHPTVIISLVLPLLTIPNKL